MSEIIEPEAISTALNLPLELVQGVLNGTITESALDEYNPGKTQIAVVEKTVLTRGKTIAIIDAPAVAAAMAVYIAEQHTVGVLDTDHYPILPLFTGLSAKDLPRYVNYLWDKETESRPSHKENLFLFLPPDSIKGSVNDCLENLWRQFSTVLIHCSLTSWRELAVHADIIYLPQPSGAAGLHRIYQIVAQNSDLAPKIQIVWMPGELSDTAATGILRRFSNVQVAGVLSEQQSSWRKQIKSMLEPLFPTKRRALFGGRFML